MSLTERKPDKARGRIEKRIDIIASATDAFSQIHTRMDCEIAKGRSERVLPEKKVKCIELKLM